MKLIFVHDGPIFYDENGKYYEYSYHGLLERYSYLADEITFLMRTMPLAEDTKGTPIPDQIRVVSVPNFKSPAVYFTQKPIAEKIIEEEIRNTDYAVLRGSSCAGIAMKYCRKYNKPFIYECVGCTWDSLWNHSLLGKLMAPHSFLGAKKVIRDCEYVYYVTNEFLQKRYPTKGKSVGCSNVVINPVEDVVLESRLNRIGAKKSGDKILLGTAAALDVRYKGQEYVIMALKKLVEKGYDVEYHLAGGNRLKSTFLQDLAKKHGVEDRVIFHGSLSAGQMPAFYDSLDIYIQPSKQEGLPRSVIEAMSRGCPVAGTNIAGIPELLQDMCLFKKGSTQAVVAVLDRMLQSDLSVIAKENFANAKQYELAVLTERRNRFYDAFLADQKSR